MKYQEMINKNIVGNSVEVMKEIPDGTIDLVVTSPPYDNLREYKNTIKDEVTYEGGYTFPFKEMVKEMYRIVKKGGIVVWVVNDQVKKGGETGTSFRMALHFQEIGFTIYDTMIYHKNGAPFPEVGRYSQVYEYMFVFSKGKPNTVNLLKDKPNRWAGSKNFGTPSARKKDGELKKSEAFEVAEFGTRYNVWYINNGKGYSHTDDLGHNHPASFPESLAEDHILSWTNEGDIVLDPMAGGGTTCKMAYKNNRKYIGIDWVDEYVDIINDRIELTTPYTDDNPNPKLKFLVSRDEILAKRKKTREENKTKEVTEVEEKVETSKDESGLYQASGLKEVFEEVKEIRSEDKNKKEEDFWDDIKEEKNEIVKEDKGEIDEDIDHFWTE